MVSKKNIEKNQKSGKCFFYGEKDDIGNTSRVNVTRWIKRKIKTGPTDYGACDAPKIVQITCVCSYKNDRLYQKVKSVKIPASFRFTLAINSCKETEYDSCK